jgi:hypothetical protein
MTVKSIALLFLLPVLFLFATVCSAQTTQPSAIFDQGVAQYQSMPVYCAEGTITCDLDTGSVKTTEQTTFSIKMKKPNQYLITWNQTNAIMPAFVQAGAVWNAGSQPYLYMSAMKAYFKMTGDEMALGSATGISSGAAYTIPSLFLPAFKTQPACFSRLLNPQIESSEQIDDDDCYVISSSSTISKKETFWISKSTHLIRKYSRSLEPPAGGMKLPQMTDQQLDDAIKASGQPATDATRQQMRNAMNQAQQTMQNANLKGLSTERQLKVSSPDLKESDFVFKLPPDATLKDSLFGGATNANSTNAN